MWNLEKGGGWLGAKEGRDFFFLPLAPPPPPSSTPPNVLRVRGQFVTYGPKMMVGGGGWGRRQGQREEEKGEHFCPSSFSSSPFLIVQTHTRVIECFLGEKKICGCFSSTFTATTQPPAVVCKMKSQLKYIHNGLHIFARLVSVCMLGRCLVTRFLHRSSVRSLLRVVGWVHILLYTKISGRNNLAEKETRSYFLTEEEEEEEEQQII